MRHKSKVLDEVTFVVLIVGGIVLVLMASIGLSNSYAEFQRGFHNIDLAYNTLLWVNNLNSVFRESNPKLNIDYRHDIFDTTSTGQNITYIQAYVSGLNQMSSSLEYAAVSAGGIIIGIMFICLGFMIYIRMLEEKNKPLK